MLGKFVIKGIIEVKTGLRIGGSTTGLKIGGVDLNVITDPEGKPYIPGSSLKLIKFVKMVKYIIAPMMKITKIVQFVKYGEYHQLKKI